MLGQRLAQERAFQSMIAVVDRYCRVAGEQRGAEALFELLFGLPLGDHRHQPPSRQYGAAVNQKRFPSARRWRTERMQGRGRHRSAVERCQDGGQRYRTVGIGHKRKGLDQGVELAEGRYCVGLIDAPPRVQS